MDVVTAFLNPEIDKVIYMEFPDGYNGEEILPGQALKLLKGLYGLKQAAWLWNCTMHKFLVFKLRFEQCENDKCV